MTLRSVIHSQKYLICRQLQNKAAVSGYWKSEFAARQTAAHTVYFRTLIKVVGILIWFYWLWYEVV